MKAKLNFKKLNFLRRRKRAGKSLSPLRRLKRTARLFVPTPGKWIVIPFKPLSALLILVLAACTAYLVFHSDIFLIRRFEFREDKPSAVSVLSEETLQEYFEPYLARSLLSLKPQSLTDEFLRQFPALASITITKKYPDRLLINWQERQPLAIVIRENQKMLVDESGLLYAEISDGADLPEIQGLPSAEIELGKNIRRDHLTNILAILNELTRQSELKLQTIKWLPDGELEIAAVGWKAIFSLEKDIAPQTEALLAIINKYHRDGIAFSEVDLRFKFPVVR